MAGCRSGMPIGNRQLATEQSAYEQTPRRHHGPGGRHVAGRDRGRDVGEPLRRQERHRPDHAAGTPASTRSQFGGECTNFDVTEVRHRRPRGQAARPLRPVRPGRLDQRGEGRGHRLHARKTRYRCGVLIGSGIGGIETLEEQNKILIEPRRQPRQPVHRPAADGQRRQRQRLDPVRPQRPQHRASPPPAPPAPTPSATPARLIQHDMADVMIAGGSEAALCELGMASFCAARALSTRNDDPDHASRPWDKDRDGFVMAEGAGVVDPRRVRARQEARRADLRRAGRLRHERRRLPHHRPRRGRPRRVDGDEAGPEGRRRRPPTRSTTSTPTAPARRWATSPRPRPSRRPSASTPRSWPSARPRASSATCWAPAAASRRSSPRWPIHRNLHPADDQPRQPRPRVRPGLRPPQGPRPEGRRTP